MKNLENSGGLSKLERLLNGLIDIFMSRFLQRLYRKVQNLSPSSKDDPVVESEVHATDEGERACHGKEGGDSDFGQ